MKKKPLKNINIVVVVDDVDSYRIGCGGLGVRAHQERRHQQLRVVEPLVS